MKILVATLVFVLTLWQLWLPFLSVLFLRLERRKVFLMFFSVCVGISFIVRIPGVYANAVVPIACDPVLRDCPSFLFYLYELPTRVVVIDAFSFIISLIVIIAMAKAIKARQTKL